MTTTLVALVLLCLMTGTAMAQQPKVTSLSYPAVTLMTLAALCVRSPASPLSPRGPRVGRGFAT